MRSPYDNGLPESRRGVRGMKEKQRERMGEYYKMLLKLYKRGKADQ